MTDTPRESPDGVMERHDGPERAECVGQWCCGCAEHPIGKPWGWASERWAAHYDAHHFMPESDGA